MNAEVLEKVSRACLHGNEVPPLLAEMWAQHLENGESVLIHASEASLCDSTDGDFFAGYRAEDVGDPAMAKAYQKMFDRIAFFAKEADGALIGFWLGDEPKQDLGTAPVVALTNEGSFQWMGRSLGDYLVYACDPDFFFDDDETVPMIEGLRRWLAERGFDQTKSRSEIDEDCNNLSPSLDELFDRDWAEARSAS